MWTEVYASGYKQYRLVQLGPAVRTNDEPEQAAVVTHLTLYKAEMSTGYTLPSRSNLHF